MSLYRLHASLAVVMPVIRVPSQAVTTAVIALLIGSFSLQAQAQTDLDERPQRGEYFVGGSVLIWSGVGANQDPSGPGYLRPYFHGSLDWPAAAAMLNSKKPISELLRSGTQL